MPSERVFVLGEDIGKVGGVFSVTDGLLAEFGAERVLDTPLAESASSARDRCAVYGLRPVAEMQFSDFVISGFDQLCHVAGKTYYRIGQSVPIIVRLPSGGGFTGAVPLAEPRGVVHARAGPEGRRAEHAGTPRAC